MDTNMTDEVPANPTGADDGTISVDQAAGRFRGMLGQDEATDETNERGNAKVEGAEPEEEAEAESPEPTETPESDDDSELEEKQPRYTVKVNGEERRVTLEEMKKNHMFEAITARKHQSLPTNGKSWRRSGLITRNNSWCSFPRYRSSFRTSLPTSIGWSCRRQTQLNT